MDLLKLVYLYAFIVCSIYNSKLCNAVSVEQDLSLTKAEKLALDKFKQEVIHLMPEAYMKEDIYLIRWLRAKNLNQDQAKELLLENLRWRKMNNMSRIHQEDWSDLQEDYQYQIDSFDKTGRPIATLRFGEWDIRRACVSGKAQRLTRYLYKALDEATAKVRSLQSEGKQVSQWTSVLDMEGYAVSTHGCFCCLGIYLSYATAYENHFPGSVHDIILVNTPSIFEVVLRITKPLLGEA
ncbi:SEC14-like protein 2, partial [Orchesella cincta]